mgnify:CR=1 FL=1
MRKFGIRLLAAVAASSLIATPVFAAPSVSDLKDDKAAVQTEVNSLKDQLAATMEKLDELETDLIAKGEEITQAEEDLKKAEEKEKQQYEDMKLRIKYMYEQGDVSMLETLVTADNFTDFVNNAEYVQNVYSYDREKLDEYVATKKEVETLKTTLEEEQKSMESMQSEYEEQEQSLNATIEEKQGERSRIWMHRSRRQPRLRPQRARSAQAWLRSRITAETVATAATEAATVPETVPAAIM